MINPSVELKARNTINFIPLFIVLALLFLRFPFLIFSSFHIIKISSNQVSNIFLDTTYLLTALWIWLMRNKLSGFHIGFEAIILFILTPILKPFFYLLMTPSIFKQQDFSWFQLLIAILLGVALLISRTKFERVQGKILVLWVGLATFTGLVVGAGAGYLNGLQGARTNIQATFPLLLYFFYTQLSTAAIAEEPLFRGIIWGYLKNWGWKDFWVWLFQAFLFFIGHIYYWDRAPFSLWIIVPAGGLILGFFAWRSRSVATSMIVHGLINSVSDIVAHYRL